MKMKTSNIFGVTKKGSADTYNSYPVVKMW